MKNPPVDSDISKAIPAMQRAAQQAARTARQTGTALIVSREGKLCRIKPDQKPQDR